jgi:DNA invertase Pin-like site-specific DNA recombinase
MTDLVAVGVLRVSKKRSAGDDHYSIPAQSKAIKAYCETTGITLLAENVEPGTSAFTGDIRKIPGLYDAMARIERGEANALIVHESSRLARTEKLTAEVADRLEAVGARFINVSMGGIDYSTPEGRMILANEAALNSYWSRKTGQHARKGKAEQFAQGLHVGQIPFGYVAARTQVDGGTRVTRKLPMLPAGIEAEAVQKAFRDRALGKNAHQIAREWNDLGLKPHSHVGIQYFQPQTVRGILANRVYAGFVKHLGEERRGLHEPLITEEEYWRAQHEQEVVARRTYPPLLLRGIATCAACGFRVYDHHVRHSRKDEFRRHHYYREASKDFGRACPTAGKLWRAGAVDEQVETLFRSLALDSDWLEYVEQQARAVRAPRSLPDPTRIEMRLERAQDEYMSGRLSKERWDQVFQECQAALFTVRDVTTPLAQTNARFKSFVELWGGASEETRNEACRVVFEEAVIDFAARELRLKPWPEFEPLFDARVRYVEPTQPGRGSQ